MKRVLAAMSCTLVLFMACGDDGDPVQPPGDGPTHGTKTIEPVKDNTIYEDVGGAFSNGAGENLFIGKTSGIASGDPPELRRALLMFDVAAAVPANATVDSVFLVLFVGNRGPARDTSMVTLHRLSADWGEEGSLAAPPGGGGAQAFIGDATWIHTFFDTAFWATVGGDFVAAASDTTPVFDKDTFYTWGSTAAMVADVQGWLSTPSTNYGWIVLGNEAVDGSAKQIASRENTVSANRPKLTIHYTTP